MSEVAKNINEENSKIKSNYTQDFKDQIIDSVVLISIAIVGVVKNLF